MSWLRTVYFAAIAGLGWGAVAAGAEQSGPLVWEAHNKTNQTQLGGVTTHFTFKVQNTSAHAVVIDDLKSSCGCTVAQMPSKPWRLGPGESNKFEVLVDLRDKPAGSFEKEIDVLSTEAPDKLLVTVEVQPGGKRLSKEAEDRIWGQELAVTDHQAVFKRECVKCHLVPAFGRTG